MKTFPLVAAEIASGKPITTEEMGGPSAWIDYAGGPRDLSRRVPFSRVLNGQFPPGFFKDKVVVDRCLGPDPQGHRRDAHEPQRPDVRAPRSTRTPSLPLSTTSRSNRPRSALDLFLIALMGVIAPLASYRLSPYPRTRLSALLRRSPLPGLRAARLQLGAGSCPSSIR